MAKGCCDDCVHAWGMQWRNTGDGVKYWYYCDLDRDERGERRCWTHSYTHCCDRFESKYKKKEENRKENEE